MGGCIGLNRDRLQVLEDFTNNSNRRTGIGITNNIPIQRQPQPQHRKNQPLCQQMLRWKSDVPLTEGQLLSKRDEFWDTAPAFDGRNEIWDALRAAAHAGETMNFAMAQAILDGANITLPTGYLTECYDELGTRYQVPLYCLTYPVNIVRESGGGGRDSPADCSEPLDADGSSGGSEVMLKLRVSLSGCSDVKLRVSSKDTIALAKRKLQQQEGFEPTRQRWYFGGKLLGDKLRVEEARIPQGYVIQVVINSESLAKVDS